MNLLIILADELRRDALGCYGNPDVATPCMDAMARDGVRFKAAYSTYPVCVPFRFSFMTGECAHSRMVPCIEWRMSPAERTLADEFNEAGYHTAYVGKWHLYGDHVVTWPESTLKSALTPIPRRHRGRWGKWLGFELRNDPFNTWYFEDDDPEPRCIEGYQTDGLFDLAMQHLETGWDRSNPFCCVVSVEPPHFPFVAPAADRQRWEGRELHLPPSFGQRVGDGIYPHGKDLPAAERERMLEQWRTYYAMVENLDHNVGRMDQFLKREGLDRDTIVVVLSDHGETGGCHGLPMGYKLWPYDHAAGIPLIVRDPRLPMRAGACLEEPVNTEDLFPTFLGLCGRRPLNALPGSDLAPLIRGARVQLPREGVALELDHDHIRAGEWFERQWRAFRSRRYKYAVIGGPSGAVPWSFFDLQEDPHELHNRIDDPALEEEVRRHHGWLRDDLARTEDHYVLKPVLGWPGLNDWNADGHYAAGE